MGAVLKLYDDQPEYKPQKSMKIPLQSEVAKYMNEKMGWDKDFCRYYADKFWNHYQAQGWKLSNGNSMKDWQAAFNSQWQTPKFKEDIDKLNEAKKSKTPNILEMDNHAAVNYLDSILLLYKSGMKPDRESAEKIYQWLKGMNWFNLPPDAIDRARVNAGNRMDMVWMYELKEYLDLMVKHDYTFKQWLK
jgi:hypothetical protein